VENQNSGRQGFKLANDIELLPLIVTHALNSMIKRGY
jgi:hypothetical protein